MAKKKKQLDLSEIGEQIPDDLVLTAIVAIRDDVRKEVPAAVEKMHKAGVQVMMVTGDTLSTAKAIARDSGIICTLIGSVSFIICGIY